MSPSAFCLHFFFFGSLRFRTDIFICMHNLLSSPCLFSVCSNWNKKYVCIKIGKEKKREHKGFYNFGKEQMATMQNVNFFAIVFSPLFFPLSLAHCSSDISTLRDQKKNLNLYASTLVNVIFVGFHIDFPCLVFSWWQEQWGKKVPITL